MRARASYGAVSWQMARGASVTVGGQLAPGYMMCRHVHVDADGYDSMICMG